MIYHFSAKYVKASKGKCAVASAAYQSAEELYDERLRETFSYKTKEEVTYSEILLPKNAPERLKDRQVLWNEVEKVNKNKNARYARQFEIALPKELTIEQNKVLAHEYVQRNFVDLGMVADWAYHDKPGNPHLHLMVTMRGFKPDGTWAPNEKKGYVLDADGNKIPVIDPKTGKQKIGARNRKIWKRETQKLNDWDTLKRFYAWRKDWADSCNRYVRSIDPKIEEISHLSYRARGIDKVPTIHEGYAARKMEQEGEISDRMEENRFRRKLNEIYDGIKEKIGLAHQQLTKIKQYIERRRLEYGSVRNARSNRYTGGNAGNPDGLSGAGERYRRGSADREFELAEGTGGAIAEGFNDREITESRHRISSLRARISELDRRSREIADHHRGTAGYNIKTKETDRKISDILSETKRRNELRRSIAGSQHDGADSSARQKAEGAADRERQIEETNRIISRYGDDAQFADFAGRYVEGSKQRTENSARRIKRVKIFADIIEGLDGYRARFRQRKQSADKRTQHITAKPAEKKLSKAESVNRNPIGSDVADPMASWRKRRDAVDQEIQALKREIATIDKEFTDVEEKNLQRQQRIKVLQKERDECGLLQGDRRKQLTEQIEAIRNAPQLAIENQEQKIQRRKQCRERLDKLIEKKKLLQQELTDIMESQPKMDQKKSVKQDQTLQQKKKPTIRRKL